jgi:pyruvate,water dikinase
MSMSLCVDLTAGGTAPDGEPVEIGGKARSLLRLLRAGYPVPAAFAVTGDLFQRLRAGRPAVPRVLRDAADLAALDGARDALATAPWPAGFLDELDRHLARVAPDEPGARFSVRSSFAGEDGADAIAAGVYESVVGVARGDVPAAIRRVLASGLSPGAVTYTRARSEVARDPGDTEPLAAALIHAYVAGPSGSAAFDPTGTRPAIVEVSAGAAIAETARAGIERAVRDLAARAGHPVEIEWVLDGDRLVLLQLRAYAAPPPARAWTPGAALGPGAWRWDSAHNPLPLSPAQAGLVELCDARCRIGIRQRVAGGYLFYASDGPAPAQAIDPGAVGDELAALVARFEDWQRAHPGPPALEEALAIFVELYDRIYGLIQPAARRATRGLDDFLRAHLGGEVGAPPDLYAGVESMADERLARADDLRSAATVDARTALLEAYLARFGDEAPIWDVAAPTYREEPARLLSVPAALPDQRRVAVARAATWQRSARAIATHLAPADRATFATLLEIARRARAVGEDDDWLYARAQAAVRAALLREGERLVGGGLLGAAGDVFWLPFERVRAWATGEPTGTPAELQARVAAARADHTRALHDPPELAEDGDRGLGAAGALAGVIRGRRASAGRVLGRAVVYRAGARSPERGPGAGAIVVAATLLPTELPLISAAGLVVETGGVLDHVAAQARERGIPAIVGARGACSAIADGDLVLLDADAGQLIRLG